jgi:transcriptional regulator with XRE-family HTH domain
MALYQRIVDAELRLGELRLAELRRGRGVSQATVADALDVSQPNISRIEQSDDLRLSTLNRYVAALGGRLEVQAIFDDASFSLLPDPTPPAGT